MSAGAGDIAAVQLVGMQDVWSSQKGEPWERFYGDLDLAVEDFHSIADAFGALDTSVAALNSVSMIDDCEPENGTLAPSKFLSEGDE